MNDESAQNDRLPDTVRTRIIQGLDCDEIAGAKGEFGRDYQNPIPVNGPLGQLIYLTNLYTIRKQRIMFHRIGSVEGVDAYEVVTFDNTFWDILFLNLYHPRKSRRAPAGYTIDQGKDRRIVLSGTNEWVDGFPRHLQDAIRDTNERLLGLPLRPRPVREAVEQHAFERPRGHQTKLDSITNMLSFKQM